MHCVYFHCLAQEGHFPAVSKVLDGRRARGVGRRAATGARSGRRADLESGIRGPPWLPADPVSHPLRLAGSTVAGALDAADHQTPVRPGRISRSPDSAYRRTVLGASALDFDAHAARIRALTCPTAVVWCEDDPLVEARISRALAEGSPPGPRLEFADGGHNPQKHYAVEIAEAIASLASAVK